jgi:Flp pilus assembly protein TadG
MALELSIVTPAIIALLWMMISAGRVVDAASKVEGAARDGARAASINHAGQPLALAKVAVQNSLHANGIACVDAPTVGLSSKNPITGEDHGDRPQPGDRATVTVSCRVALLLGADATVTRDGVSVLDTFRGTT